MNKSDEMIGENLIESLIIFTYQFLPVLGISALIIFIYHFAYQYRLYWAFLRSAQWRLQWRPQWCPIVSDKKPAKNEGRTRSLTWPFFHSEIFHHLTFFMSFSYQLHHRPDHKSTI